jgi:hypothetical protein
MKNDFKTKLSDFYDYFAKLNKQRIEDLKKKTEEHSKSISRPLLQISTDSFNAILYQDFNDWVKNLEVGDPVVAFKTILLDKKELEQNPLISHTRFKEWLDNPQIVTEEEDGSDPYYIVFPMIEDIELIEGIEYGFLSDGFLHNIRFYPWEDKEEEIQQKVSEFSQFIETERNLASEIIEEAEGLWEEGVKQEHQENIEYCVNELKTNLFVDSNWKFEHVNRDRYRLNKEAHFFLKKVLEQRQIPESEYYYYEKYIIDELDDLYRTGKELILDQLQDVLKNDTDLKEAPNYQARYVIIQEKAKEIPDGKLFTLTQNDMKRLYLRAKRIWDNLPEGKEKVEN